MRVAKLSRSAPCGKPEARTRFSQAEKFLEVAELVESEALAGLEPASASVAAALAILAGIAASDAACCAKLGMRSRGDDHQQAQAFLKQITSDGAKAASHLSELISKKDTAHYGVINISQTELKKLMRRAQFMVEFAKAAVDS
jgi:hypothetical protein